MKTLYKLSAIVFVLLLICSISLKAQAVADPASLDVLSVPTAITVDGLLNEAYWGMSFPYLMFQKDGTPSGNGNTVTGGAEVKTTYTDVSTCLVKILHKGLDLYISLSSDDKSICIYDWEGEGLFMKVVKPAGGEVEYKLYVIKATQVFGVETNGPATSIEGAGVALGTICNSADVDNGYTGEIVIHLDQLGFTAGDNSVQVMMNIFDPDGYGVPPYDPSTVAGASYYKQWWGSEWGGTWRTLNLVSTNLPVELTSFTAKIIAGNVNLEWKTATELNNNGFEIQRSVDKVNFGTIGFVQGKGTTTTPQSYSYIDKSKINGVLYYRLKQIDFGGKYDYSSVIEVKNDVPAEFSLSQNYPNPFNPTTSIKFALPVDSKVTLQVYNMVGQVVAALADGNYSAGTQYITFDASSLTSGIYIYSVKAIGVDGSSMYSAKKMTIIK
jgi:hypothetical protein